MAKNVPPRASALLPSLSAFGYSLQTAVADLVDNSITAGARHVQISADWHREHEFFSVLDDGCGMTGPVLEEAMRFGSRSPREEREKDDLGRYGLGLKTASLSQCRQLSVYTKTKQGDISFRCWDLDSLTGDAFLLLDETDEGVYDSQFADKLHDLKHGTIVVWKKMDWLCNDRKTRSAHDHYQQELVLLEKHLGMVFHRFIEKGRLHLHMNGTEITAWNPFLKGYFRGKKTSEEVRREVHPLPTGFPGIGVTSFTLPHASKFLCEEAWGRAGGMNGWTAQQGFYVYRNNRLLVPADWLGVGGQKDEHTKLARIQVDLTSRHDYDWKIDVRKSKATPPLVLRQFFRGVAAKARADAEKVYRYRGQTVSAAVSANGVSRSVWLEKQDRKKVFFRINRDHPTVLRVLEMAGKRNDALTREVEALLRMVEQTIPVDHIVTRVGSADRFAGPFELEEEAFRVEFQKIYRSCRASGLDVEGCLAFLQTMDPFYRYPDLVGKLAAECEAEPGDGHE